MSDHLNFKAAYANGKKLASDLVSLMTAPIIRADVRSSKTHALDKVICAVNTFNANIGWTPRCFLGCFD